VPKDGSAWLQGRDPSLRAVRGGSWFDVPQGLRAATRGRYTTNDRTTTSASRLGGRLPLNSLQLYIFTSWVQGEALVATESRGERSIVTDDSRRTGAALEAHYRFLAWLVPAVEKFPKSHKFTIGHRVQTIALDVLEALVEATYTKERGQHLRRAKSRSCACAADLIYRFHS
jgi:hypothetical protein